MSLQLDATASARNSARVRGVAWLVQLDFAAATARYSTAPVNVPALGHTWLGAGSLCEVSALSESADTSNQRVAVSFTAVNSALLAATLGDAGSYRGRRVTLYLQWFDEAFQPAGQPVRRWAGYMDKVTVERTPSPPGGGDSTGRISMQCTRAGMARARNFQGLRLTHAQQQQRYPGDTGLRYVSRLLEQPSLWLSRRFQQV